MKTRIFMSFFFPFPALKLVTVAMAMLANFALGKKKIKFLKSPNFHLLGVYLFTKRGFTTVYEDSMPADLKKKSLG